MTAQPVEQLLPPDVLDPASPEGTAAADAVSDFAAEVLGRLHRDGLPVPAAPAHSP